MNLNPESCYQALLTHDARFDGVFFVGVTSTRIYCRTVCTAKAALKKNCSFYPSAAAAESAGFRPCLRCRPELAPGNARIDAVSRLAAAVADRIEDGALADKSIEELAAEFGISDRHLRRVVESEFGVSPLELAQTHRLLLAKRLLTDTKLPITEVAFASGFASIRRFNAIFKERYRMNPSDLRKSRATGAEPDKLVCELAYRAPLDWQRLVNFLRMRAVAGVEFVDGDRYMRTVAISDYRGWITAQPIAGKNVIRLEISISLARVLRDVLCRVKRLFDLNADPQLIAKHLGVIADTRPGLRVPGAFDGFEIAVRAILGQQVSVKAATTLAGRFVSAFGERIDTPFPSLTHLPVTAERITQAQIQEIAELGIVAARANSIITLAKSVSDGLLILEPHTDVIDTIRRLKQLPGIGEWTAQYIAMRALSWPDAFPHTDLGIYKALGEKRPQQVLRIAEAWQPWRAYATMQLWSSLEVVT